MTHDDLPEVIQSSNLSLAWGEAISRILSPGGGDITPLLLSITGFDEDGQPTECAAVREALESLLENEGKRGVDNVAFTIFPQRYWTMVGQDRHELYALYSDAFARIQEFNPKHNKRGSYFQRLIDFAGNGKGPNQLEWILSQYKARPTARRSM